MVVTGVYEPIPLEEADRALRTFDVEKGLLLSNSLVDLLQLDPSVDVRQRAPGGIQSDVSIRGGAFGQTLVLLDGLRLNDVQSGHHDMDLPVPVEAVARIEILRGPGSTLYGSDAAGGVVNVVTRSPEASEFRLRTAVGNFGINQQRVSFSVVRGRISQQFAASRDFSSGFQPNRDYRNLSLASTSRLSTALGTTAVFLGHSDRPFGADNFYGNFPSWERTRTWFASLKQDLGEKTQVAFAFRRHSDLFVLYRDRPEVFTNRHAVESYQGTLRRREDLTANMRLFYGAEFLTDSIESNNLGRHARNNEAGYISFDARALRRFSFTAGLRDEVHGSLHHELSPTVSGGAWLSQHLKLRASASRAFRLPTYTDLYYHDPANIGSPNLRPETAWSCDGGLDWNAGGRIRGDLTVFHRFEHDVIDYVRNTPSDIWRATNFQRLQFTGVEASAGVRAGQTQMIDFRYTGLRGVNELPVGVQTKYVFNYPTHSGIVSWQGSTHGFIARTRVGALQRVQRNPYGLWDVYLARGAGKVNPFVQLANITSTRYEEVPGVAMPGRSMVVGLQYAIMRH